MARTSASRRTLTTLSGTLSPAMRLRTWRLRRHCGPTTLATLTRYCGTKRTRRSARCSRSVALLPRPSLFGPGLAGSKRRGAGRHRRKSAGYRSCSWRIDGCLTIPDGDAHAAARLRMERPAKNLKFVATVMAHRPLTCLRRYAANSLADIMSSEVGTAQCRCASAVNVEHEANGAFGA